MKLYKYTEQELKDAIASSSSTREALSKLGVKPAGGNYDVFRKAVKYFNLDTSHFEGQSWSKDKKIGPRRSLKKYLSNEYSIQSNKLRIRLLHEGIFDHICQICNSTKWNDQPIPLELDHINGDNKDNSLSNIRLICPNCHAQTSNYRGKNIGKK